MVANRHTNYSRVQRLPSRQVFSPSLSVFVCLGSMNLMIHVKKKYTKFPYIPLYCRKPVKKIGAFCWLSLAICVVELLICVKFGHGLLLDLLGKLVSIVD